MFITVTIQILKKKYDNSEYTGESELTINLPNAELKDGGSIISSLVPQLFDAAYKDFYAKTHPADEKEKEKEEKR